MKKPAVPRSVLLAAIRALADENGEVGIFGPRLVRELGISISTVHANSSALVASGDLIRLSVGHYRLPDAVVKSPVVRDEYPTAHALGIEPITHLRAHLTGEGNVVVRAVTLARVPWLERPVVP